MGTYFGSKTLCLVLVYVYIYKGNTCVLLTFLNSVDRAGLFIFIFKFNNWSDARLWELGGEGKAGNKNSYQDTPHCGLTVCPQP